MAFVLKNFVLRQPTNGTLKISETPAKRSLSKMAKTLKENEFLSVWFDKGNRFCVMTKTLFQSKLNKIEDYPNLPPLEAKNGRQKSSENRKNQNENLLEMKKKHDLITDKFTKNNEPEAFNQRNLMGLQKFKKSRHHWAPFYLLQEVLITIDLNIFFCTFWINAGR